MEQSRQSTPDVVAELQRRLIGADGITTFLAEVARYAVGAVEHALACGVTVGPTRSSPMLGATTGELAGALDEIQYDVDDGPCLTCLRTGSAIRVDDIQGERRWPAFAQRGHQAGAGSSVSVPLMVDGEAVGALNLYSRIPHELTDADRARAQQFADQAAGAVALARMLAQREENARHLEIALTSRSTIDQAIGVIVGQTGVTVERAFELLRTQSQHTNQKLREVAADIVTHAVRPH